MLSLAMNSLRCVSPDSARWQMLFSMAIFGTLGFFSRYTDAITSAELSFYRAASAAIIIGGWFLCSKRALSWKRLQKDIGVMLISGVALAINWLFMFEAFRHTSIALATISYYFAPVLVTILCPFLFHEKLTTRQILCFVMSTLGLGLIVNIFDYTPGAADSLGIFYGLLGAVFYAIFIILNKYIRSVGSMERSFWQFGIAALVMLPYTALTDGYHLADLDFIGWSSLAFICLVHTVIMHYAYFQALGQLTGQETAILGYIDPLVAVLISYFFFNETMTTSQILGALLIFGFTLWNELQPSHRKEAIRDN
ncbi:DMT family transporter [Selenomonas ruminantium]|uniref:Permease of the drug/metabolite transporter (DMT) superfamily n=1 Tax=Selenomonas ruminantium TaxID=971 RepID=A0A1I0Y2Y5_SELRU|nr:DMT family transporter [Selenomonas ruminantium]SFB06980.1 Permease of the drug/metabolite transporter (DMT) superfamily [Selenomonas ruminantium]